MRQRSAKVLVGLMVLGLLLSLGSTSVWAQEEPLVRSVEVQGNTFIDDETIKAAILKTSLNEPVVEQQILDDLRSIYDLGYFQDASASFEPALGGIQVVFHVEENPIVQDVSFSGLTRVPFGDYAKEMQTQPGYILNVHDLWEDLYALREWIALEHGYLARIADLSADTDGSIHVELAQTVIKDIIIEGNEKTRDFVIEREFSFDVGDPVNVLEVDQSLRRVLMLGYFDEISRDFSEEDDPDETVLTVNLEERKTGAATFGVSYSSGDGLVGFVEVSDDNLFGRGQRMNASARLGRNLHSFELGFHEPYITKSGISLGANLYRRVDDLTVVDSETEEEELGRSITNGGDLTLGRPFSEYTRGRLNFKMENNKYPLNDEAATPSGEWPENYNNRAIGFGVNTNTVDHPFNPTEGFKSDAFLQLGTNIYEEDGATPYAKLRLEYSRFFEIREGGYVLALRGMGGRLLGGELGENEKFKIGGANTLRGYSHGDLQGDHMLVANAEFRFPIVDKITGVVFTDWGTTWDQNQSLELPELDNSFGLGVRLDTPLGLLRLDYGWGKDDDDSRKGQFYFGLGQTF